MSGPAMGCGCAPASEPQGYTHPHPHSHACTHGPVDVVLEVDVVAEVHLGGAGLEDHALLPPVGVGELDLAVQAACVCVCVCAEVSVCVAKKVCGWGGRPSGRAAVCITITMTRPQGCITTTSLRFIVKAQPVINQPSRYAHTHTHTHTYTYKTDTHTRTHLAAAGRGRACRACWWP
jgi:hypothetical protein